MSSPFPTIPANGMTIKNYDTNRYYTYSAATNTWERIRKADLLNLYDVSSTPPNPGDSLMFDEVTGFFTAQNLEDYPLVPIRYETRAPVETDYYQVGTVWSYSDGVSINRAWIATATDGVSKTMWQEIAGEDWFIRPIIPVQSTAPTDPIAGDLWFDNSSGSIVKKYWKDQPTGGSWVTLTN